jgi:hypothetical protein
MFLGLQDPNPDPLVRDPDPSFSEIMHAKKDFNTKLFFKTEDNAAGLSYKKKIWEIFFVASLKSLMKEVGSRVGSGSFSQMYGSPNPHQKVTDPQHWGQES